MKKLLLFIPFIVLTLIGCTNNKSSSVTQTVQTDEPQRELIRAVVRTAQYTLVEISPSESQQNPLEEIVFFTMDKNIKKPLVKDAMHSVIKNSGYRLCENSQLETLFNYALPTVHYSLGPIKISDALKVIAGKAYKLEVNHATREACFSLNTTIDGRDK